MAKDPATDELRCPVVNLLLLIYGASDRRLKGMHRSLVVWSAWCIDQGSWWSTMSPDAIVDAAVPRGPRRNKRLDENLVEQYIREAGEGAVFRTASIGARMMNRIRK